jgi:hypothetical protein
MQLSVITLVVPNSTLMVYTKEKYCQRGTSGIPRDISLDQVRQFF